MIEVLLLKYKELTEAIIFNIKNELDGETLLNKRGELLIELLEDKTLSKEEIKNAYIYLGIKKLDNLLKEEIDKARERNKENIKEMQLRKNANQAYGKNLNLNITLNTKI